jgi:hypothetical protein
LENKKWSQYEVSESEKGNKKVEKRKYKEINRAYDEEMQKISTP